MKVMTSTLAIVALLSQVATANNILLNCKLLSSQMDSNIQKAAHAFMKKAALIGENDEVELPEIDVSTRWTAMKTVSCEGKTLVVMGLQSKAGDQVEEPDAFDVLISTTDAKGNLKFSQFKDGFIFPKTITVAIGHSIFDNDPQGDFYYVQFTGKSVAEVLKSVYSQTPYLGFSGHLKDGGKASFDPTPGRTWRIVKPLFNMRRGNTPEIEDVRPIQLDTDFEAYFKGSAGRVAPWSAACVRKIFIGGEWLDAFKKN